MAYEYLNGKTVVITGAGGTLCGEIAQDLAAYGARVVLIGRTREKLEKIAEKIRLDGNMVKVAEADVTDETRLHEIASEIRKGWEPCTFLLNGAGGNHIQAMTSYFQFEKEELSPKNLSEERGFFNMNMEKYEEVLKINTLGTVLPCRVFGLQMVENGGGVILNFASMNSYRPLTRVPAYGMSKAAIVNFTQWLAVYLAPAGIRVNAIAPGFFVNERSQKYLLSGDGTLTQRGQNVMQHTPLARFGEPKELLGTVRWLLDDVNAGFVTGITLPVDGGFLASSGI